MGKTTFVNKKILKVCSYFFIDYYKFVTKFCTVVENFVENFLYILLRKDVNNYATRQARTFNKSKRTFKR